jgi:hypothetical protein
MKWMGALVAALTLCHVVPAAAQDDVHSRATLVGLEGVRVVIADVGDELIDRGITPDVVSAEVHLQLREAGIEMLEEVRRRGEPRHPVLFIEVLANLHERYDQASFSIRVEVRQDVRLERNKKILARGATTWSVGGIGESGTDWRDILRDELSYYVARFVEAFAEANPS